MVKNKTLKVAIAIFTGLIMISSILGVLTSNQEEDVKEYKGYEFVLSNYGWLTYKDNKQIFIISDPDKIKNTTLTPVYVNFNTYDKVYFTINPEDGAKTAISNLYTKLPFPQRNSLACYEDFNSCQEMILKTCADADASTLVVYLEQTNQTETITFNNNCLSFKGEDLTLL